MSLYSILMLIGCVAIGLYLWLRDDDQLLEEWRHMRNLDTKLYRVIEKEISTHHDGNGFYDPEDKVAIRILREYKKQIAIGMKPKQIYKMRREYGYFGPYKPYNGQEDVI